NIPIGKPICNTYIYILDDNQKLLPVGEIGEIYIGGNGLAKGYLNLEKLSSEKFIPNPFVSGELLYKTGDLAKCLSDGNLEYLGRIDEQVKINGYRIELGEIENALLKNTNLEGAAVIVDNQRGKTPRLVAYLKSSNGSQQTISIQN